MHTVATKTQLSLINCRRQWPFIVHVLNWAFLISKMHNGWVNYCRHRQHCKRSRCCCMMHDELSQTLYPLPHSNIDILSLTPTRTKPNVVYPSWYRQKKGKNKVVRYRIGLKVEAVVYWGVYAGIRRIPTCGGFFWQSILTSVIINKQGTFRPFATPHCIYPPPFLAIHHWAEALFTFSLTASSVHSCIQVKGKTACKNSGTITHLLVI